MKCINKQEYSKCAFNMHVSHRLQKNQGAISYDRPLSPAYQLLQTRQLPLCIPVVCEANDVRDGGAGAPHGEACHCRTVSKQHRLWVDLEHTGQCYQTASSVGGPRANRAVLPNSIVCGWTYSIQGSVIKQHRL